MKATKGIVLGVQLSMSVAFLMTQGCVTSKTDGSKIVSGHHRGPFNYYPSRKNKVNTQVTPYADDGINLDEDVTGITETPVERQSAVNVPPAGGAAAQTEIYIVKKGDILSRLAVRFHSTTKELISLNNLSDPNRLYVGQELHIPRASAKRGSASVHGYSSVEKGQKYEIRKGDTLSAIAVAANVSIDDLRRVNNIKNDRIFAGEIIYIPKGGKLPSSRKTHKSTHKTPPTIKDPEGLSPTESSAPAIAPPVNSLEAVQEVVVEAGDSLDSIAKRNNTTKSAIMRLNGITDESEIKNGQRLQIPIQD